MIWYIVTGIVFFVAGYIVGSKRAIKYLKLK